MKTKTQVFLEDIVSAGKDIMKNNFLIPPKDMEREHFASTIFFDTFIGGLTGSYIASQDGDWRKAGLGVLGGFLYGCFAPLMSLFIRDIRDSIKDYRNSLETRAKGYDNSKR